MAEIKVPKPPKTAFNPKRRASGLLRDQVEHLEWAVRHAGDRVNASTGRKKYEVKAIKTEADVAARMAALLPRLASADKLPFETAQIPEHQTPAKRKRKSKPRRMAKRRTKR